MFNDTALKQSVLDELAWEPSVNAAHIGVTTHNGVVTLSGHVAAFHEKRAAEAAARRVKGVKAVAEEVEVKLSSSFVRDDEEIAAAAIGRLAWNSAIPQGAIQVTVEKGWVTLTGDVDWQFQRDAAAHDVRALWGVVGVSNTIHVKPQVNTANLGADITNALHRAWYDPQYVMVTAVGGKVTLSGTVKSRSDRMLAAATAWAAPGATEVENDLVIA